ncbi:nitrous oxide reductase accessory protein NosL [Ferrimonas balearica]|uniref:nitrous oxide reductase accessory protein NosL n=1 Tax=Ferrimonas balearica TaxID=44012 RepID=UPI001C963F0F|nr:nitrous oxide reductase accessory protein NosL [Ferrimonas balearica]MBY5979562.1 nitrous oxide reductase accessory protein NosL [Ferrimonas balearica]
MRIGWVVVAGLVVAACCQHSLPEPGPIHAQIQQQDRCHLCGMVLVRYPGPKGVAELATTHQLKFCSSRDLFAFLLQPDKGRQVVEALVHDMNRNDWHQPQDQFVRAEDAWYVYGSDRPAAMGPALASFGTELSAQRFADQYGGQLLRFDQISLALLSGDMRAAPGGRKRH